jgi:hypothetical protein
MEYAIKIIFSFLNFIFYLQATLYFILISFGTDVLSLRGSSQPLKNLGFFLLELIPKLKEIVKPARVECFSKFEE